MTPDEFRQMALEIPEATEGSHDDHPDFRLGDKIFASLGAPDVSWGMIKVTPEQQASFMNKAPTIFFPSEGEWGDQGYTHVFLPGAPWKMLRIAFELAAKNA